MTRIIRYIFQVSDPELGGKKSHFKNSCVEHPCERSKMHSSKRQDKLKQTKNQISWLTTFLLCYGGVCFKRLSAFQFGTNTEPLLVDLFLYSYEADFIKSLHQRKEKRLAQCFGFTLRYKDDVLSLNNSNFGDYLTASLIELEIKNTTET